MDSKLAKDFYVLKGGYDEVDGRWYLGRARLFFVNKFKRHKELCVDYDINVYVDLLTTTLESFQIKVDKPIINPSAEKMIQCFEDDTIDYFGFAIIFVFSHGEQDYIFCSDYNKESETGVVDVWKYFYYYFGGEYKPKLRDCPKVFFNELWQSRHNFTADYVKSKLQPTYDVNHWLIYYIAQPNYLAAAAAHDDDDDKNKIGSHFAQVFCQLLRECGKTKDLNDVLSLVTEENTENLKPFLYSSMNKTLYLLPERKIYLLSSTFQKEFDHITVLGMGKFGAVFQARDVKDNLMYAVKRIQVREHIGEEQERIKREIDFLAGANCLHIVRYYRAWNECTDFDCQKQEDDDLKIKGLRKTIISNIVDFTFIQMELCRETLENYLNKHSRRDKVESLNIFEQIVKGLAFLHAQDIIHRDLKPSNVLFAIADNESDFCVRLTDIGPPRYIGTSSIVEIIGSPLYMAPEMVLNHCDSKWDIFSAGLILIELLYNCCGDDHDSILLSAKYNHFPDAFYIELKFALALLKKLLCYNSNERPSSNELLNTLATDPVWKADYVAEEKPSSPEVEVKLESICTSEEHLLHEVSQWSVVGTIVWNGKNGSSGFIPLPTAASTNTQWEVRFVRESNDFGLMVRCRSLNAQFRAASIRLFAFIEGCPQAWAEVAAVLVSSEESVCCCFSRKFCEMPKVKPLNMRVRAQWTELEQLSPVPELWDDCIASRIICAWQLKDWKAVTVTTDNDWRLFSETFGLGGALWRMFVESQLVDSDYDSEERQLMVGVLLQHVPPSVNSRRWSMKCSLSLWDQRFEEEKRVEEGSCFYWRVVDDVELETRNLLDFNVIIQLKRKN